MLHFDSVFSFISTYSRSSMIMMLPRRNRLGAEYKTPSARTSKKSVPQMHATPHFQKPHNKGKNLLHRMNATKLRAVITTNAQTPFKPLPFRITPLRLNHFGKHGDEKEHRNEEFTGFLLFRSVVERQSSLQRAAALGSRLKWPLILLPYIVIIFLIWI